ncbi:MAG: hypothetical protein IT319_03085 [Anaerolineae bacterium]|nr:hypothetical protein [Anaerolineae bacterium]
MSSQPARTKAEAEAQAFSLPARLDDWRRCAVLLNGYEVAKDMGFDLMRWGDEQFKAWRATGTWNLDVLELRLMLFMAFRASYWSGYTYHEHDEMADSLLRAISAQTGLPYPAPQEDVSDGEK